MQTIVNLTRDVLKKLIKDSIEETLSDKKLKSIFHDVIEDIALSKAIDEGIQSETIDKDNFIKKSKSCLQ